MKLAVTTSGKASPAMSALARRKAVEWGVPFYARGRKEPITPLLGELADALLVFGGDDGVSLWDREGEIHCHPGIAKLRIKELERGGADRLIEVTELRPGDRVLDCTLGLGQDALVMAKAVGESGKVVGLEKSFALYALASTGLTGVEVVHADAAEFLRQQPTGSFDVVYFDPMFDRPKKAQPSFEVLRRYAEHAPLGPELFDEARRVTRRWVVVKAGKYSGALKRLGLEPFEASRYATFVFGRVSPHPGPLPQAERETSP